MAARKNRKSKATVNYAINTPFLIIHKLTQQQQRAEYTALRDIVQKRIKRIARAKVKPGEASPRRSEFFKRWEKGVPKIRDIPGGRLPYLLAALIRDVQSPETTIKGYRESVAQRVKDLHEAGYQFITRENLADFGEFMEEYRANKLDHVYGSPEVAEFYQVMVKKGISSDEFFEHFQDFMVNKAAISRMRKPIKSGKFEDFKAHLTKTKKWKKSKKREK